MNFFDRIERVQRIHKLIRNESTGAPKEFAEKLHLRERQLYNLLEELKCYGADIRYNVEHSSYVSIRGSTRESIRFFSYVLFLDRMRL
ncbi:MAG: hypothetical protein LBT25_05255 [Candidatus Symbiothrix sp.]|jgi:hypothetical protein|nr:hypothetical protein [Candidatus Symbiothrix sp.]